MMTDLDLAEYFGKSILSCSESIDNWHILVGLIEKNDKEKLKSHLQKMKRHSFQSFSDTANFIEKHRIKTMKDGRQVIVLSDFAQIN